MATVRAADLQSQVATLIAGYPALARINAHEVMDCDPCRQFTAALFRGADPATVQHLRCAQTREWQAQVDAALAIVKEHTDG